jgi:hypothetical protein
MNNMEMNSKIPTAASNSNLERNQNILSNPICIGANVELTGRGPEN